MKKLLLFLVFFFFAFRGIAIAATSYPNYSNYVNDFAHVFSADFVTQLDAKLLDFDQKTSNQIAVVTVDSTQPDTIEDYSIHLADKWKVGQKGKDNGVIMLFAMKDRQMRIEVGRGLEGDLTDIQSKHIETDIIAPQFKAGNYQAGVSNGVTAVIAAITHDASTTAALNSSQSANQDQGVGLTIAIFIIIFVFVIFMIAISPHTRLGGKGTWGTTTFWGGGGNDDDSGGGFGGFGGGGFSGGGSSSGW